LSEVSVYEHSSAISNIYVDNEELITDDYDGVVILRSVQVYLKYFYSIISE
jgi:hypothetical protein